MKNADLVVELGMEEIPAWMLEGMAGQFLQCLLDGLRSERLSASPRALWYTPRRIIVGLGDIPVRQEDLYEDLIGPPRNVAYGPNGEPTKAAVAFAQKTGVPLSEVRIVQTSKGAYLSVRRKIKGKRTRQILEKLIPDSISKIPLPKSMHWTPDKFRFARPLRWILALYGGQVVKFAIAGINASNHTVGHRFMGRPKIRVSSLVSLRESLEANGVLVDAADRASRIREGLVRESAACGGTLIPDDSLLKTVVNLNEYPTVIRGSFDSRFLELPQEILITVMREHQKYFSVADAGGKLLPAFLTAVNLDTPNPGKIRAGHERVLRARLADAAFFWQADRRIKLADRLNALRSVLFQEKLGSYFDKTQRILALLPRLAELANCVTMIEDLRTAGMIAKCDLVTEMVKEFTDLQGIVGGLYARAEGYPETVWQAVYEHYQPKASGSPSPSSRTGALLALADRLDTVCGCFSVGLIPSGSKDPFALRRQGNGVLKILLDHRIDAPLSSLVQWSLAAHGTTSEGVTEELKQFFAGRLRFLLEEAGYAFDCINAALAVGTEYPLDAKERAHALQSLHTHPDFLSVASNFRRIVNILEQGGATLESPDPSMLVEPAEIALWKSFLCVLPTVEGARKKHDYTAALHSLASMRQAVDDFFETVLVMAEDPAIRANRLALLNQVAKMFFSIADISQIVLEKER